MILGIKAVIKWFCVYYLSKHKENVMMESVTKGLILISQVQQQVPSGMFQAQGLCGCLQEHLLFWLTYVYLITSIQRYFSH